MSNICVKISPDAPVGAGLSKKDIVDIVTDSLTKLDAGLTRKLEIEIIFVTKEEITALNLLHRRIDAPTDVLSFPQAEVKASLLNILGSIVICPEMVLEKDEEMTDVIKHGLLHILGYDHETTEGKWDSAASKINCKL